MVDMTSLLIVGIYVLLIFCLFFFFMIGVRIYQLGNKITQLEGTYRKEVENVKERVDEVKINLEKTRDSLK